MTSHKDYSIGDWDLVRYYDVADPDPIDVWHRECPNAVSKDGTPIITRIEDDCPECGAKIPKNILIMQDLLGKI